MKRTGNTFFYKQRYFIFFFAFLMLYTFLVVNRGQLWRTDTLTYMFHLVDYSFGFCSKFLPGAIYNALFRADTAVWKVICYETVLLSLFFMYTAFLLSKMILAQTDEQMRKILFVIFLFYLTGPCTFAAFTNPIGSLDAYWLFLSAAFLTAVGNRFLKYTIPLIYALAVCVHFSAVISYILFFSALLLYEIANKKQRPGRGALIAIFGVALAVAAVLAVYFITHEGLNLRYDMERFHAVLDEKKQTSDDLSYAYFDFDLYKDASAYSNLYHFFTDTARLIPADSSLPAWLANIVNAAWAQIHFHYLAFQSKPYHFTGVLCLLALLLPAIVFFFRFWIFHIKAARGDGNRLKAFAFFCMLVQLPVMLLLWYYLSWDRVRYVTHAFLIQFTLFLYVMAREPASVSWLKERAARCNKVLLVAYFLVYASVTMNLFE